MILAIYVRVMVWREVELVEISYGSLAWWCKGFSCSAGFFAFPVINADIRCFMSGRRRQFYILDFTPYAERFRAHWLSRRWRCLCCSVKTVIITRHFPH
jgi:hypothetical protein